jgi:hypothetical protein
VTDVITFNLGSSSVDDLRAIGFVVDAHYDYTEGDEPRTFWLLTINLMGAIVALKGRGKTDADALDQIRREFAARWETKT